MQAMLVASTPSFAAFGGVVPQPATSRAAVLKMGLFDGVKDAFGGKGGDYDKPLVAADRVTPFDRWMGLDKALVDAENQVDESAAYIDPNDLANYYSISLPKPMGIAFVENDGECAGVYVDQVLAEGSASGGPLSKGDQLVGVDGKFVAGVDFDTALDAIKATEGEKTKLTFFRGPTAFLYGPSKRAHPPAPPRPEVLRRGRRVPAPHAHRPSSARVSQPRPLPSGTRRRCSRER